MSNDSLGQGYEKYQHLIAALPLKTRLKFLAFHPDLVRTPLSEKNTNEVSNCWGTSIFLVNATKEVRELGKNYGGGPDDDWTEGGGNYVYIPYLNRPGYVGMGPMTEFLTGKKEDDLIFGNPAPGGIVSFWWSFYDDAEQHLQHAAVFLGNHEGRHILFHQRNLHDPFEFLTLEDYCDDQTESGNFRKVETFNHKYHLI